VVDEGTGEHTYVRRAAKEIDRVLFSAPPCLSASPFFRPPEETPALAAVAVVVVAPAAVPAFPAPDPQMGLW